MTPTLRRNRFVLVGIAVVVVAAGAVAAGAVAAAAVGVIAAAAVGVIAGAAVGAAVGVFVVVVAAAAAVIAGVADVVVGIAVIVGTAVAGVAAGVAAADVAGAAVGAAVGAFAGVAAGAAASFAALKALPPVASWRSRNGVVLISRQQTKTESLQRIAVKTPTGETLVGTFKLPPGLKNGKTIRHPKVVLEQVLPGHAWPDDGVEMRIRVPNWPLRSGLAALVVIAGIVGGAGP